MAKIDPKRIAEWRALAAEMDPLELYEAVTSLLAEREEMLSLLREVEWANEGDHCPACGWANPETREPSDPPHIKFGHAPDCRLAFLKE